MAGEMNISQLIQGLQNAVQAINNLNQTLAALNITVPANLIAFSSTAATATAGAGTLPANPVGFVILETPNGSGTFVRVPYYNP